MATWTPFRRSAAQHLQRDTSSEEATHIHHREVGTGAHAVTLFRQRQQSVPVSVEIEKPKGPNSGPPFNVTTASQAARTVTTVADLPDFDHLFGSGGKNEQPLKESYSQGIAGLVHIDGSATIVATENFFHHVPAIAKLMVDHNLKPLGEVIRTFPDVVATLNSRQNKETTRRKTAIDLATPGKTQEVLNGIIDTAVGLGASDVHINVFEKEVPPRSFVTFRIDGAIILQRNVLTDPQTANAVCRAAYTGDQTDSASRSDTGFKTHKGMYATMTLVAARNARLRLQTMPEVNGYGLNFRLLSYDGLKAKYKDLIAMGFAADQQKMILSAFGTERGGLVLFIAGTGEGKTTSLMTGIPMEPRFHHRRWISIEDPVEILHPDIFQSPVKRETGVKDDDGEHIAAIANSLRFDPDGINAGEIRDEITAKLSVKAAMTGHITCATLHSNDVFMAFNRLIEMGVRKSDLLGVIRVFCHQKLVQCVCPDCSKLASKSDDPEVVNFLAELSSMYKVDTSKVRIKGPGCDKCYPSGHPLAGVKGRTVVAEVVRFNRAILEALRTHDDTYEASRVFRLQRVSAYDEEGTLGKILSEHALYKLLIGKIDPDTYLGVAEPFDTHNPMPLKMGSAKA